MWGPGAGAPPWNSLEPKAPAPSFRVQLCLEAGPKGLGGRRGQSTRPTSRGRLGPAQARGRQAGLWLLSPGLVSQKTLEQNT